MVDVVDVEVLAAEGDSGPVTSLPWVSPSPIFKIYQGKQQLCIQYAEM